MAVFFRDLTPKWKTLLTRPAKSISLRGTASLMYIMRQNRCNGLGGSDLVATKTHKRKTKPSSFAYEGENPRSVDRIVVKFCTWVRDIVTRAKFSYEFFQPFLNGGGLISGFLINIVTYVCLAPSPIKRRKVENHPP